MHKIKKIAALLIVLVFSITVIGCSSKTVAEVNGEKITRDHLDQRMKKEKLALEQQGASFTGQEGQMMLKALEQQTLKRMIDQILITQTAQKEGVYPSKKEIEQKVKEIVDRFGGEKEFEDALKQYNYTRQDIEDKVAFETAYTQLYDKITADVKVSDTEVKDWYDNNKERYKDPAKIGARAILVKFDDPEQSSVMGQPAPKVGRNEEDARKLAEDIIKELDKGTDFAKLAKEKSEDDVSKEEGGLVKDLAGNSPYSKGMAMPPQFDEAAMALDKGEYTKAPVKTSQGFYIIKLESLTPEKQLTFEEAKERIEQELPTVKKQQMFAQYIEGVKQKAKIDNKLAQDAPQPAQQQQQQLPADHPPVSGDKPDSSQQDGAK